MITREITRMFVWQVVLKCYHLRKSSNQTKLVQMLILFYNIWKATIRQWRTVSTVQTICSWVTTRHSKNLRLEHKRRLKLRWHKCLARLNLVTLMLNFYLHHLRCLQPTHHGQIIQTILISKMKLITLIWKYPPTSHIHQDFCQYQLSFLPQKNYMKFQCCWNRLQKNRTVYSVSVLYL